MIRPAAGLDRDAIFALRNDEDAVRYSATGPIREADKNRWFAGCMSYARLFLVATVLDEVVGYVRVDVTAEVSVAVAKRIRGMGYGRLLIEAAVEKFPGDVRAIVHEENTASLALFRSCGFTEGPTWAGKDGPWVLFERPKR